MIGYKDSFLFGTGTSSGAIPTMSELYASLSFTAEEKELKTEFKSIAAKCDNSFSILRELCGIKQWVEPSALIDYPYYIKQKWVQERWACSLRASDKSQICTSVQQDWQLAKIRIMDLWT